MSAVTVPDDEELERLAVEELLREAARGAVRAETQGPSGWLKCPLPKTNRRFLRTTLKNIVSSNERRQRDKRTAEPEEPPHTRKNPRKD